MIQPDDYLFLASAIAGRRVGIHVAASGQALASSDGQSIILPPESMQSDRELWPEVVAQAALIGAGSLDPALIRKLVGRRDAAQRYGYLEVLRATRYLSARMPDAFTGLDGLQGVTAFTATASESLDWAISTRPLPQAPAYFGVIRPLMTLRKSVSDEGLSALTRKQAAGEFQQKDVPELDEEDEGEESKILKLFQSPFGGNNPVSDMLQKLLGAGSSKGKREKDDGASGGQEMPVGRIERALRRGVHAVLAKLPIDLPDIDTRANTSATSYPEWDDAAQAYKPNWVMVEEVDPWRPEGPRDLALAPASQDLKRQLGQLGLDHEMHRRQIEGTELDVGRLLDCAVTLATGNTPATLDVYRASRRTRRDLAVAVALDISGSTGEANAQGPSVFDQQMLTAYQLARTLDELGDHVALFGFHSWGRQLVHAVRLKGPEERWSARMTERFAQIEPLGYTRTGAAIRHGTRLLNKTMRLPNRLLVLITDGIAYDQDYEASYAESDTRKALEEARGAGTAVICLCIGGSQEADKLRKIFGVSNLLVVDEPGQVVAQIRRLARQALGSVSRRKLKRDAA